MTLEKRSLPASFELPTGRTLTGYAAVWDSPTVISEGGRTFTEVIRRGAFRKAVESKGDVIASFNHNPDRLLGRVSSGTLQLAEDSHGLRFELDLPDHAADVKEMVSRGDLNGASFTFNVRAGGDRWDGNQRELLDLYLFELGPVAMPAYAATSVGLRSKINIYKKRLDLLDRI